MVDVDMEGADLSGADLRQADLSGADLYGCILDSALLEGVTYDERTIWPEGFDPAASGCVLISAS